MTSVIESAPSKSKKKKMWGGEEGVHATRKWESGTLTATIAPRFPHHGCWHRHMTTLLTSTPKVQRKSGGKRQVQRNDLDVDARRPCTVRERIVVRVDISSSPITRHQEPGKQGRSRLLFISAKTKR